MAWLTLNRPERGNAIDLPMARALARAAMNCEHDAAIRCVVIRGEGAMFCAGGDVGEFARAGDGAAAYLGELAVTLHLALARLARMPKPLVTVVHGPAAGAGFSLALLGDVALAGRSAHFTAAYGGIGLTPDGGMTWLLPRLVGLRRAQEIILTNQRVAADEAAAIGLVTRTLDDDALDEEAASVVAALVRSPVTAVGTARGLLLDGASGSFETQLDREARAISAAGAGPEAREGVQAFLDRRPPVFQGV